MLRKSHARRPVYIPESFYTLLFLQRLKEVSLCFLEGSLPRARLAPQPHCHECDPSSGRHPNAGNPDPSTADKPASWIFVMGKMPDSYFLLVFDIGKERALIVDFKSKDTMLVGGRE